MRRPIAFAEVLEEKLGGGTSEPPTSPKPAFAHIPTVRVFFFEFGATARPVHAARGTHPYRAGPEPATRVHCEPSVRPRRSLTSREQAALDQLNALGASIGADFTVDGLRSAFRALAPRYHPDRHPGSSASEQARLSMQFVQLNDAYRELQSALPAAA
jgi:hypothetical protein